MSSTKIIVNVFIGLICLIVGYNCGPTPLNKIVAHVCHIALPPEENIYEKHFGVQEPAAIPNEVHVYRLDGLDGMVGILANAFSLLLILLGCRRLANSIFYFATGSNKAAARCAVALTIMIAGALTPAVIQIFFLRAAEAGLFGPMYS